MLVSLLRGNDDTLKICQGDQENGFSRFNHHIKKKPHGSVEALNDLGEARRFSLLFAVQGSESLGYLRPNFSLVCFQILHVSLSGGLSRVDGRMLHLIYFHRA